MKVRNKIWRSKNEGTLEYFSALFGWVECLFVVGWEFGEIYFLSLQNENILFTQILKHNEGHKKDCNCCRV